LVAYFYETDLLTYLSSFETGLTEKDTFYIFKQITSVIKYLHSKNIVHGDIKLENILYDKKNKKILLIDFGSSTKITFNKNNFLNNFNNTKNFLLNHLSGTPQYVAPEVILREEYDGFKSDIYSLGVVLYGLSTNRLPFDDEDGVYYYSWVENYYDGLRNSNFRTLPPNCLSKKLINLLCKMLAINPNLRGDINDISNHPWLKKNSFEKQNSVQKFNLKVAIANLFN